MKRKTTGRKPAKKRRKSSVSAIPKGCRRLTKKSPVSAKAFAAGVNAAGGHASSKGKVVTICSK